MNIEIPQIPVDYQAPNKFPEEVKIEAAALTLKEEILEGRTAVEGFYIDRAKVRNRDDLIKVKETPSGYEIEITIVDVDCLIESGSRIDQEALKRVLSVRNHAGTAHLLPGEIINLINKYHLKNNCPALTFFVKMSKELDLQSYRIAKTYISKAEKLTYEGTKQVDDQSIISLLNLALKLHEKRLAEGALTFYNFEKDLFLSMNGRLLYLKEGLTPGIIIIQELKILAKKLLAKFLQEQKVKALYSIQASPLKNSSLQILIEIFKMIKTRSGAETAALFEKKFKIPNEILSDRTAQHFSLNLEGVISADTPLRRYVDLFNQRILKAVLEDRDPRLKATDITRLVNYLNARIVAIREFSRDRLGHR